MSSPLLLLPDPLGLMQSAPGQARRSAAQAGGTFLALRHAVLPAIAFMIGAALAMPPEQRVIIMLPAALPTASSAYVLAARMGGDAGFVAELVTVSTLLGMISIPLWLTLLARLHRASAPVPSRCAPAPAHRRRDSARARQ